VPALPSITLDLLQVAARLRNTLTSCNIYFIHGKQRISHLNRRVFGGYLIARVRHSKTPKTRSVPQKYPSEYFGSYVVIFRQNSQFALNSSTGGRDKWNGPQVFGRFVSSYDPPGKGLADWVQRYTFRWDPPRSGCYSVFGPSWGCCCFALKMVGECALTDTADMRILPGRP